MSYNIRSIREISTDPTTKFVSHLAKRISDLQNASQQEDLENKEDIYSNAQDIDTVVKLHSDLTSTNNFTFNKVYYSPTEPDLDKVRLMLKGYNMGNSLKDWSGFDNEGIIYGDPILIDGTPFDYGIHDGGVKSRCLKFNRIGSQYENQEYVSVPDVSTIRVSGITTGISYFIRFRVGSVAQQGGSDRRLFEKTDDATPSNAVMLRIGSNGALKFNIKRAGTEYNWDTASGTIAVDTVYDVFITYSVSGNTVHIYVNNVDKTLSAGSSPNWHTDLTNLDLYIFRRGPGTSSGYVYGDLYDFIIYREQIVTSNAIGNSVFLDGTNDYIQLTNDSSLWSTGLTKFSFSIWVYSTANVVTADRYILSHGNGSNQGFRLIYVNSSNKISFLIKNAAGTALDAVSNSALPLNQWVNLIGTYDNTLGSQNIKLYLNKTLQTDTGNLTETINLSDELTIGTEVSANTPNVYVKDFRFWKTKALTQTEVNNVVDKLVTAPMPNYWLPIIEGTGNPVDTVAGKVGTLTNGASWITNEVGNIYTNKCTIAGIPFGQIMHSDYYATYTP